MYKRHSRAGSGSSCFQGPLDVACDASDSRHGPPPSTPVRGLFYMDCMLTTAFAEETEVRAEEHVETETSKYMDIHDPIAGCGLSSPWAEDHPRLPMSHYPSASVAKPGRACQRGGSQSPPADTSSPALSRRSLFSVEE